MKIFSRADVAALRPARGEAVLLLEGSWPESENQEPQRWALDDALDARHAWIDREASRLADAVAGLLADPATLTGSWPTANATARWAFINALPLRYQLVKLLRLVAFFEQVRRPAPRESMELHGWRGRDEMYACLLREISRRHGFARTERLVSGPTQPPPGLPPNRTWRRRLGAWTRHFESSISTSDDPRPRVVLCGNPRILNPLCSEFLLAGCRVWWLYDRWAARNWLRWAPSGVNQLVCDTSQGRTNAFATPPFLSRLTCRGIDLSRPLTLWMQTHVAQHGTRQTRLMTRVAEHFANIRPHLLVVDEDATPLPRVAVATARNQAISSAVIQHGAPCIRFGFAPLVADRAFVWGHRSAEQLASWGVPHERIVVAGSPAHDYLLRRRTARAQPTTRRRVLLLATVPPRDDRPDALTYHLTTRAHEQMLEDVGKVVDACPDIEMIVRLHPRTRQASAFQQLATQHDRIRLARGGPLWRELQRTACVISCASSAGVEAVRAGVPVIQLLPQGSGDLLSAQDWGFVGTARNAHELASMLRTALAGASEPGPDCIAAVFANLNQPAAPRIVSQLLEEFSTRLLGSSTTSPRTPSPSEMDSCRSNSASYERRPAG